MQVIIERDVLIDLLDLAGEGVASRASSPIMTHYEIRADLNGLVVTGFSYDFSVRVWGLADVVETGVLALPAKLLHDYISAQPSERLTLTENTRDYSLTIKSKQGTATIKGMDPNECPLFPELSGEAIPLALPTFARMITNVAFSASDDQATPSLGGINLTFADHMLEVAATDGYRLAYHKVAINSDLSWTTICPASLLRKVSKLTKKADPEEPLYLYRKADQTMTLAMQGKGAIVKLWVRLGLVDARFPNFWAIVPKTWHTQAVVEVEAFKKALQVAALFARGNANIVHLNFTKQQLQIQAVSTEFGDTATELAATVNGPDLRIAFNVRFLLDVLDSLTATEVVLEVTQSTRPLTLYPQGVPSGEHFYVLMPMNPPR